MEARVATVELGRASGMTQNLERAFTERPEVFAAWQQLNGAIKAGMDLRRYELVTLAAARRLQSSYCCLAHGWSCRSNSASPCARSHSITARPVSTRSTSR